MQFYGQNDFMDIRAFNGGPDSEGDRSAIGKPEICDRDQMEIGHQKAALSVGILAIGASVIGCDR